MKKEIEKIKQALIGYDSSYFKIAFCEHEKEKIPMLDFEGKTTSGIKPNEYFYRCKKCGAILDENGLPKIERT